MIFLLLVIIPCFEAFSITFLHLQCSGWLAVSIYLSAYHGYCYHHYIRLACWLYLSICLPWVLLSPLYQVGLLALSIYLLTMGIAITTISGWLAASIYLSAYHGYCYHHSIRLACWLYLSIYVPTIGIAITTISGWLAAS